ncbi:MAG: glycerol kinase, partial [Oscillospiraceae bacterium]|nr:glycerol kinase [Oscillospiraceae bacterium]
YVIPAFTGIGAPHWDPYARGAILGLTRGSERAHIVRATLEAIAYQSMDVIQAMREDTSLPIREIRVDGGASANNFLMQFQADLLDAPVLRSANVESTAFGAACLAGLGAKLFRGKAELPALGEYTKFPSQMPENERAQKIEGWRRALRQVLNKET